LPLYSPGKGRFACAKAGFIPASARLGEYIHYAPLCIKNRVNHTLIAIHRKSTVYTIRVQFTLQFD